MLDRPYFMENEEWYKLNPERDGNGYILTEKAPKEAVESYNDYYRQYYSMYPHARKNGSID